MQELIALALPYIPFVALVSLRLATMLASLPAPLGSGSPVQIRVALTVMLTLALCTPLYDTAPRIPLTAIALGRAALGEAMVGAVIGLTVRVTLAASTVAGNLAGLTMGQGFAGTVDPTFDETSLPLGRILGSLAVLLYFFLRGPHITLAALAETLRVAPVGRALGAAVGPGALAMGGELLAQGLRIASPVVGTMFLVQIGMGLIARSAPRVQIFILTFAITSAVGMFVLVAAAPSVTFAVADAVMGLERTLRDAVGAP